MKKYAVIVDSTAILSVEAQQNPHIYVVPLQIIVDGKCYRDQIDLTQTQWIEMLENKKQMSTSQPTLADSMKVLEEVLAQSYDHVFILPITSQFSGTYNGFKLALQEYDNPPVTLIDTLSVAGPVGYMAERVMELAQHDAEVSEVVSELEKLMDQNETLIYADSLERLMLSGRLNKTVGTIASFLRLKILLIFRNKGEKIEKYEVYRTSKKMMQGILDYAEKNGVNGEEYLVYLLKVNETELFEQFKELLHHLYPQLELRVAFLPGAITTHAGLGAFGVQFIKKK